MNEIYWLTRLDVLCKWLIGSSAICGIVLFISILGFLINKEEYSTNGHKSYKEWMIFCSKVFKISMPSFILIAILTILIPTTKQAFLIYGVGNTIDFIQNNETAKQLPDKCINALNAWVESLTQEEKKGE